jgi:hypothetical protein
MTISDIIIALGGVPKVAARFGISRPAVYGWSKHGIPSRLWMDVLEIARAEGLQDITPAAVRWRPEKISGVAATPLAVVLPAAE